jgi:hypothetical protein
MYKSNPGKLGLRIAVLEKSKIQNLKSKIPKQVGDTSAWNYGETLLKLVRAIGECLGVIRRRRTRQAAKSFGERLTRFDPEVSEWGNPTSRKRCYSGLNT